MKNTTKALTACLLVFAGTAVFAHGPGHGHHHHGNDGVRLATDIVNLVGASLNVLTGGPVYITPPPPPPPVVVVPPPPPRPIVVAPPPRRYAPWPRST